MKKLLIAILILVVFIGGFFVGRDDTMRNAKLTHVTEFGYEITYHGQTYYYDYE